MKYQNPSTWEVGGNQEFKVILRQLWNFHLHIEDSQQEENTQS